MHDDECDYTKSNPHFLLIFPFISILTFCHKKSQIVICACVFQI